MKTLTITKKQLESGPSLSNIYRQDNDKPNQGDILQVISYRVYDKGRWEFIDNPIKEEE